MMRPAATAASVGTFAFGYGHDRSFRQTWIGPLTAETASWETLKCTEKAAEVSIGLSELFAPIRWDAKGKIVPVRLFVGVVFCRFLFSVYSTFAFIVHAISAHT